MKTNVKKVLCIVAFGFIGLFFDSLLNTHGSLSIVFTIALSTYFLLEK